jgi:hypothetical protein
MPGKPRAFIPLGTHSRPAPHRKQLMARADLTGDLVARRRQGEIGHLILGDDFHNRGRSTPTLFAGLHIKLLPPESRRLLNFPTPDCKTPCQVSH